MRQSIVIGFIVMMFVGCGGTTTVKDPAPSETPQSPVTQEKGKTPPSIPVI